MAPRSILKMPPKSPHELPTLSQLYATGKLEAAPPGTDLPQTISTESTKLPDPSKSFNDRVCLYRGDITKLKVDAIVNAANARLAGGGGVDGAIHIAAGPGLLQECRSLAGCATGSAKITDAYKLPCTKVIHAVGPIFSAYDTQTSEAELTGCYTASLSLAVKNCCRTVAFSCISTGVYGYPSRRAASVAISAVRKFLMSDKGNKIDQVIFVVFEHKDLEAYSSILPKFFPPVLPTEEDAAQAEASTNAAAPRYRSMLDVLDEPPALTATSSTTPSSGAAAAATTQATQDDVDAILPMVDGAQEEYDGQPPMDLLVEVPSTAKPTV